MPPKPGLPPLPHFSKWPKAFPRRQVSASTYPERDWFGRFFLASPHLANQFVRSLGLRKNEVVIEAFPGLGVLTRALLSGGAHDPAAEAKSLDSWKEERNKPSEALKDLLPGYPTWLGEFEGGEVRPKDKKNVNEIEGEPTNPAQTVVVIEPALNAVTRAFGQDFKPRGSATSLEDDMANSKSVAQSPLDDKLIVSYNDPFDWATFPVVLGHPLVQARLPVFNPDAPEGQKAFRSFQDPEPPITLVATVPTNTNFDSVLTYWVSSVVGAADGNPALLWKYGRVRLACLVSRSLYDRIMARPGETIASKLSIMVKGLFDVEPLPPYHHVPNVDKGSKNTEAQEFRATQQSPAALEVQKSYKDVVHPRTLTLPTDYYPVPYGSKAKNNAEGYLTRPLFLGILLKPKKHSLIKYEQQDDWDYVLRHLFVLPAQPLTTALTSLGFNAAWLKKDIEAKGTVFAGRPVDCSQLVRDLDIEDFARIVDVFANWPFKPENLLLDKELGLGEDFTPVDGSNAII